MWQIQIISIGKINEDFSQIVQKYKKMIRFHIKFIDISYTKKFLPNQIKQFEAKLISQYLEVKSYKIALDVIGQEFTSHEFTKLLNNNLISGKNIQFIIGGAYGLDKTILDYANIKLSLSTMTIAHQIVKVILLEQIYRSQTILENHPYHK